VNGIGCESRSSLCSYAFGVTRPSSLARTPLIRWTRRGASPAHNIWRVQGLRIVKNFPRTPVPDTMQYGRVFDRLHHSLLLQRGTERIPEQFVQCLLARPVWIESLLSHLVAKGSDSDQSSSPQSPERISIVAVYHGNRRHSSLILRAIFHDLTSRRPPQVGAFSRMTDGSSSYCRPR